MFSKMILAILLTSSTALASYESAEKSYGRGNISSSSYRKVIIDLVDAGYYFAVVPWMKDFLVKNKKALDPQLETAFDRILNATGVKAFESLPESILRRSRSGNIKYILAKRLMNKGDYQAALRELNNISSHHPSYPFVAHLKATVYSYLGNSKEASSQFSDCIRASERLAGRANSQVQKDQLETNKDYCIAGIARAHFAGKEFDKAELAYLDIKKESFVWPQILFEEAWTSYYLKNYNRTLGKLVSYKAPVFDFIFKPEIEVLKALSYMKLCLYDDANKTVDEFYQDLLGPSRDLRRFLRSRGKDYGYYYNLVADHESGKSAPLPILNSALLSIRKDGAFLEMKSALSSAIAEYNTLQKVRNSTMRSNLLRNLQTVLEEYRKTIGAYVRSSLVSKYAELFAAFEGMSYIKLEVLAQRKERLYQSSVIPEKKRGDVKYIERNDKQYFWTFNGEFWADELGDYVFALRSEC